jgi:hypothetical protein
LSSPTRFSSLDLLIVAWLRPWLHWPLRIPGPGMPATATNQCPWKPLYKNDWANDWAKRTPVNLLRPMPLSESKQMCNSDSPSRPRSPAGRLQLTRLVYPFHLLCLLTFVCAAYTQQRHLVAALQPLLCALPPMSARTINRCAGTNPMAASKSLGLVTLRVTRPRD